MGCVGGKNKSAPPPKQKDPPSKPVETGTPASSSKPVDSDMQGVSTQPISEVYDIVREIGTYVFLYFSFLFSKKKKN